MMKIAVFTASPNKEGLTNACGKAAERGLELAGADFETISLNDNDISLCQAGGSGWGTCREKHGCQVEDGFQKLHALVAGSDAYVFITPVYWGDLSERMKAFMDRLRRCEAFNDKNIFSGKPMMFVAAAGGSGNGTVSCLETFERFSNHVKAVKFDFISITRKSREYKLEAIKAAAGAMAGFLSAGAQ